MIRIAIVDDELLVCDLLEKYIRFSAKSFGAQCEIDTFDSGNAFICHLKEHNQYNLIFLDIEMENGSGLDVSTYIRDEIENHAAQIVYVTGKTGYDRQLFAFQPFYFIAKPFTEKMIADVFFKYMRIYGKHSEIFNYKEGHTTKWIQIQDILYFESSNRKVLLYVHSDTASAPIAFYGSIEKVLDQLSGQGFFSPHKSFVVNYRYVSLFYPDAIEMVNGVSIPIAKTRKKEVARIQLLYENGGSKHAGSGV